MDGNLAQILCCNCGITIEQNPCNMCITCIRNTIDITSEINKKLTIHSCRTCQRFLAPPWQSMQLESKELMAVCLRKIQGLSRVKLIDAVWIWTEPHSLRLKIKLTIQKEVINGAILQQVAIVEFVIRNQQCKACQASFAQGHWHAIVQVRQRVTHKKTFFYLEQLILKHESHMECIKIETFRDGIDFYFVNKNQAARFIEFLNSNVPTKVKYARKLVSANHSENTANFKHNYLVEIAPICKDDLLILPKELARNLSNISRLVLTKRIGAGLHVIDPLSGERSEISTEKYWRFPFKAVMTGKQLVRYIVLSVEPILSLVRPSAKVGKQRNPKSASIQAQRATGGGSRGRSTSMESCSIADSSIFGNKSIYNEVIGGDRKVRLAEVIVVRERDFGVNDTQFTCTTHLGNLLREGDAVLGYDFTTTNWNVDEADDPEHHQVLDKHTTFPDLILVRKCYDNNKKERKWSLRKLDTGENGEIEGMTNAEQQAYEDDYEDFLQEIEGDRELRSKINLYRNTDNHSNNNKQHKKNKEHNITNIDPMMNTKQEEGEGISMKELDDEEIRLEELLDDMSLEDTEDNHEEELDDEGEDQPSIQPLLQQNMDSKFDSGDFNQYQLKFL